MKTAKKAPTKKINISVAATKEALEKAAAKAGISVEGLLIETATMDHTWGHNVGMFFAGPEAERAAKWFAKWAPVVVDGSYNAQRSFGEPTPMYRSHFKPNGCITHFRGHENKDPDPRSEYLTGYAVSFVYFPDFD